MSPFFSRGIIKAVSLLSLFCSRFLPSLCLRLCSPSRPVALSCCQQGDRLKRASDMSLQPPRCRSIFGDADETKMLTGISGLRGVTEVSVWQRTAVRRATQGRHLAQRLKKQQWGDLLLENNIYMSHFFFCSKTCWVENAAKWEQKHPLVGKKNLLFVCRKCVVCPPLVYWSFSRLVFFVKYVSQRSQFLSLFFFLSWKIIWQLSKEGLCSIRTYDSALLNNKMMSCFFFSSLSPVCQHPVQFDGADDTKALVWRLFCRLASLLLSTGVTFQT